MRILITGADGFIGGRLTEMLRRQGHDVICHTIANGNIVSENSLDRYERIDHVFHLAAKTFVPASWEHPYDYFQTNIMGTVTVLEFCRKCGCSLTVMSTYVYGEPQYLPVDEKHPIVGMSPYHESKIACEELCKFYSRHFNIKITVLRPFNVYGKGQNQSFLIPKIFYQVLNDSVKEVIVMDLEPKRDYVYINDVISAMTATLNAQKLFCVYNVGSGVSTSVEDVILSIYKATGITKPYASTQKRRVAEISDCVADISSIQHDLGFMPAYSLADGLEAWANEEKSGNI